MNNSKIALDNVLEESKVDISPSLRQKETEILAIIEALEHIGGSNYWKVLEQHFNKDLALLQLQLEKEKNPTEIYRLQGQIKQAKKLDFVREVQVYRLDLERVRNQLHGND